MAWLLNELCRLCATKNDFLKDLVDENNKHVLDLIKTFTNINVFENDIMPTKLCIDCEEKLVSFQLFLLECSKAQDILKNLVIQGSDSYIKTETENSFNIPCIKSEHTEVKDELAAEDVATLIHTEIDLPEDDDDFQNEEVDNEGSAVDNFESESDTDDVTIAALKQQKNDKYASNEDTEKADLQKILSKPSIKVKDLVKLQCEICKEQFRSWKTVRNHYYHSHQKKPVLYCVCGFTILSRTTLYNHVTDHKLKDKKTNSDDPKISSYLNLKIKDFIDFNCQECKKSFSSWYTLHAHCKRRHRSAPVVQCSCGVVLKSKSVMYKHVQDHKNPNDLSCDQCAKVMKSQTALEKHKLRHVPKQERKYICMSCDKMFPNKEALKSHERSHIPIENRKIYHCEICDLRFTTKSSAASHKRVVHDKIKSYVCDQCGYACGTNGELRQHRAIHSSEKPFVCKKCSKPFKTYSNLKTHMDTHEDTSYACFVCSRVLNSRRTLRKHLLVHEDKCQHQCHYCPKSFKRRQTLKVHLYTHTGDKPLSCKWCDERFSYASTLRSHRLRCHPDKLAAQVTHNYTQYSHMPTQEDYIKSDLAAIGITKNEVEAVQ